MAAPLLPMIPISRQAAPPAELRSEETILPRKQRFSSRLDEMQAAVLRVKLRYEFVERGAPSQGKAVTPCLGCSATNRGRVRGTSTIYMWCAAPTVITSELPRQAGHRPLFTIRCRCISKMPIETSAFHGATPVTEQCADGSLSAAVRSYRRADRRWQRQSPVQHNT